MAPARWKPIHSACQ